MQIRVVTCYRNIFIDVTNILVPKPARIVEIANSPSDLKRDKIRDSSNGLIAAIDFYE